MVGDAGRRSEGQETFEDAAAREAAEELSVTCTTIRPLWCQSVEFTFRGQSVRQIEHYFLIRLSGRDVALGETVREAHRREGIIAARWWSLEELEATSERVFPEDFCDRIRNLQP